MQDSNSEHLERQPIYKPTFNCPHCGALAHMAWLNLMGQKGRMNFVRLPEDLLATTGPCCNRVSIWTIDTEEGGSPHVKLAYPTTVQAPQAHPDMPEDIACDFEEARQVCNSSPRAAAALLRLCVQKICNHLLGKTGRIDEQIGELVKRGLPLRAQQALDSVRVIGNESVHPGTMDLNDTPEIAQALFRLVNLIIQDCISAPKEAEAVYGLLPEGKRQGIERRDAPK